MPPMQSQQLLLPHLRMHGSQWMDPEEIESILRIQWRSVHIGQPYLEDYYWLVRVRGVMTWGCGCPEGHLRVPKIAHQAVH